MHRVHVPGAAPPAVELPPGEAHHVTRVLRLGPGDDLGVFDGHGREWHGRIVTVTRHAVVVDLLAVVLPAAEPPVVVTLGIGLLKGDQMDAVVRDATMLGVSSIAPFVSSHVALPDEARHGRSLERWARVAVASAKQSARAVVPAIAPVRRFEAVLGDAGGLIVMCVEPSRGGGGSAVDLPRPERALILVGPEGGWSVDEAGQASRMGARSLDLGPRTLRAETAPTVALAALWTHWGWR